MDKQTQATSNDMGTLAEDARALMAATADVAGEKIGEARQRLAAALDGGKKIFGCVKERPVEGAKATDATPWRPLPPSPAPPEPLAGRRDGAKEPHPLARNEMMDARAPLERLNELEPTQRGPSSLPGRSPLARPPGQEEAIKNRPDQEEVVDEITAWWQKKLGMKAVLGQASNRPPPGQRAPIPKLLWTQSESGHAQQERTVVEATPRASEERGANNPATQERKDHLGMDSSLTALEQLRHWSGVMVGGAVFFLAIVLLRFAVAVFATICAALGIVTVEFRRVRCWPRNIRVFLLRTNPLPGTHKP